MTKPIVPAKSSIQTTQSEKWRVCTTIAALVAGAAAHRRDRTSHHPAAARVEEGGWSCSHRYRLLRSGNGHRSGSVPEAGRLRVDGKGLVTTQAVDAAAAPAVAQQA